MIDDLDDPMIKMGYRIDRRKKENRKKSGRNN